MTHEAPRHPGKAFIHMLHTRHPDQPFGGRHRAEVMTLKTATHLLGAVVKTHERTFHLPPTDRSLNLFDSQGEPLPATFGPEAKIRGYTADDTAKALTLVGTSLFRNPYSLIGWHRDRVRDFETVEKRTREGRLSLELYPNHYIRLQLFPKNGNGDPDTMFTYGLEASQYQIQRGELSFAWRSSFHDKNEMGPYEARENPELAVQYEMRGLRWLCANIIPKKWFYPQIVMPDALDRYPYIPAREIFRRA